MRDILNDIKRGINIDIYLGVTISAVIAILGLVGIVELKSILAVLLGSIAIFMRHLLQSKRSQSDLLITTNSLISEVGSLSSKLEYVNTDLSVILTNKSPNIIEDISNSSEIMILGASLHSTAKTYYNSIQIALNKGSKARIMSCEPSDEISSIQIRRTFMNNDSKVLSRQIIDNLNFLSDLDTSQVVKSSLEIKTLNLPISYGLIGLSMEKNKVFYVKLMPFNLPGHEYRYFKVSITSQHGLYKHFLDQFDEMWNYGQKFEKIKQ